MAIREITIAAVVTVAATAAQATVITSQDFSTDPVLSDSQAPGSWYTDRYAPSGFASEYFMGDSRLAVSVSEGDGEDGRDPAYSSSFYNTQGRKYDIAGATSISIDYFIDSAFENAGADTRFGGMWGTGVDAGGGIVSYPILEFFDNQFQAYDFINGGWITLGTQTGFAFGEFVNMAINLDTGSDTIDYLINGESLFTGTAGGTISFSNAILQNINSPTGVNRTLYFDNFEASVPSAVPLPAGLPLLLAGLGVFGIAARRRRG